MKHLTAILFLMAVCMGLCSCGTDPIFPTDRYFLVNNTDSVLSVKVQLVAPLNGCSANDTSVVLAAKSKAELYTMQDGAKAASMTIYSKTNRLLRYLDEAELKWIITEVPQERDKSYWIDYDYTFTITDEMIKKE